MSNWLLILLCVIAGMLLGGALVFWVMLGRLSRSLR